MQKENQLKSCYKKMLSSREVGARDLPHPTPLSLLNNDKQPYFSREAEDPALYPALQPCGTGSCGMTLNLQGVGPVFARPARTGTPLRSGFTLIELLVVVLIIGILAAVALPQYQKAVWKSRFATVKHLAKNIANAEEIFYLANNCYTKEWDTLDISLESAIECTDNEAEPNYCYFPWGYCSIHATNSQTECDLYNNNNTFLGYKIMFNHSANRAGETQCFARNISSETDLQVKICQEETGTKEKTYGSVSKGTLGYVYP